MIPIFKKGSKLDIENYRPISLLSNIDKIFQKLIHKQLLKFLCDCSILFPFRLGFRPNHSKALNNQCLNELHWNNLSIYRFLKFCLLCFCRLAGGVRHGLCWRIDLEKDGLENIVIEIVVNKSSNFFSSYTLSTWKSSKYLSNDNRPLKVSLESVEVKSQFLQNLTRLKGQFIKITEDLTRQERILVKEWQDKAKNENEKEHNKIYKWRVRGSPRSGLYLKKVFCKNVIRSVHRGMDVPANL